MKAIYPVLIKKFKKDFLVYVPDLEIYTEGKSLEDAIEMARDAIGLKGISMEDEGIALPEASTYEQMIFKAKEDADAEFDYSDGIPTIVDVDLTAYRRRMNNKTVRRNVTLPAWLNLEAERARINVSKVLQEALKEKLMVSK